MTADTENYLQLGVLVTAGASGIGRVMPRALHTPARACIFAILPMRRLMRLHKHIGLEE